MKKIILFIQNIQNLKVAAVSLLLSAKVHNRNIIASLVGSVALNLQEKLNMDCFVRPVRR